MWAFIRELRPGAPVDGLGCLLIAYEHEYYVIVKNNIHFSIP